MVGRGFGGADAIVRFGSRGESTVLGIIRTIEAAIASVTSASQEQNNIAERQIRLDQRIAEKKIRLRELQDDLANTKPGTRRYITLQRQIDKVNRSLARMGQEYSRLDQKAQEAIDRASNKFKFFFDQLRGESGKLVRAIATVGGAFAAWKLSSIAKDAADFAIRIERLEGTINALTGSAEDAKRVLDLGFQLSTELPVNPEKLIEGARSMLAVGASVKDLNEDLRAMSVIATAVNQPVNQLSVIYGEILNKNRLYREDVLQFSRRGIPLMQQLEKMYGHSRDELDKMVSEGLIKFEHFQQALRAMTSEGGRFGTVAVDIMETISGKTQRFENAIMNLKRGIGETIITSDGFENMVNFLEEATEHAIKLVQVLNAGSAPGKSAVQLELEEFAAKEGVILSLLEKENLTLEQAKKLHIDIVKLRNKFQEQAEKELGTRRGWLAWFKAAANEQARQEIGNARKLHAERLKVVEAIEDQAKATMEAVRVEQEAEKVKVTQPESLQQAKARKDAEKQIEEILAGQIPFMETQKRIMVEVNKIFTKRRAIAEKEANAEELLARLNEEEILVVRELMKEEETAFKREMERVRFETQAAQGEIERWEVAIRMNKELSDVEKERLIHATKIQKETEEEKKQLKELEAIANKMLTTPQVGLVEGLEKARLAIEQFNVPAGLAQDHIRQMVIDAFKLGDALDSAFSSASFSPASFSSDVQATLLSKDKQQVVLPPEIVAIIEKIAEGGPILEHVQEIANAVEDLDLKAKAE